jgi:hypothetical protein
MSGREKKNSNGRGEKQRERKQKRGKEEEQRGDVDRENERLLLLFLRMLLHLPLVPFVLLQASRIVGCKLHAVLETTVRRLSTTQQTTTSTTTKRTVSATHSSGGRGVNRPSKPEERNIQRPCRAVKRVHCAPPAREAPPSAPRRRSTAAMHSEPSAASPKKYATPDPAAAEWRRAATDEPLSHSANEARRAHLFFCGSVDSP